MSISRTVSLVWGASIGFLNVALLAWLVVFLSGRLPEDPFAYFLTFMGGSTTITGAGLVVLVVSALHLSKSPLPQETKIGWLVAMLALTFPAMFAYWFVHVRRQVPAVE